MLSTSEAKLWCQFFDFWRQSYEYMDYAAHQHFYNLVARQFPQQKKYDVDAVSTAITAAIAMHGPINVFELGGWDGELAWEISHEFSPLEVLSWTNAEICTAIPRFKDEGWYFDMPRDRWVWEQPSPKAQLAILSHVIEHLSWGHVGRLIAHISDIPMIYIQTPVSMSEATHPNNWMGTMSTHKLEAGWHMLRERLERWGYTQLWQKDTCRLFGRDHTCRPR